MLGKDRMIEESEIRLTAAGRVAALALSVSDLERFLADRREEDREFGRLVDRDG